MVINESRNFFPSNKETLEKIYFSEKTIPQKQLDINLSLKEQSQKHYQWT